jgi:hypothetical protein
VNALPLPRTANKRSSWGRGIATAVAHYPDPISDPRRYLSHDAPDQAPGTRRSHRRQPRPDADAGQGAGAGRQKDFAGAGAPQALKRHSESAVGYYQSGLLAAQNKNVRRQGAETAIAKPTAAEPRAS